MFNIIENIVEKDSQITRRVNMLSYITVAKCIVSSVYEKHSTTCQLLSDIVEIPNSIDIGILSQKDHTLIVTKHGKKIIIHKGN